VTSSCVSMAVQSNDPVNVIGSVGKDDGKLMYPCSLKIDDHGDLYIVDEGKALQQMTNMLSQYCIL